MKGQCLQEKQNNFATALPVHLAEQANEAMKDVYMLGFLGITKPVLEREIELRMIEKIKDVILELGYGFCFIGNQYKNQVRAKGGRNPHYPDDAGYPVPQFFPTASHVSSCQRLRHYPRTRLPIR
jgi:hypothetical protein